MVGLALADVGEGGVVDVCNSRVEVGAELDGVEPVQLYVELEVWSTAPTLLEQLEGLQHVQLPQLQPREPVQLTRPPLHVSLVPVLLRCPAVLVVVRRAALPPTYSWISGTS